MIVSILAMYFEVDSEFAIATIGWIEEKSDLLCTRK